MTPFADETLQILTQADAILDNDHFVYISGDHGSGWIDKDAIFPHPDLIERLCGNLAALVGEWNVEVVCGPATGGLIVAEWTAHALGVLSAFAEHDETTSGSAFRGQFRLRRGYDHLVAGKRVLVVDDVVNTGQSLQQTSLAVAQAGGTVIGAGCLISRGNVTAAQLETDRFAFLLEYRIPAWPEATCQLCQSGVPVNTRFAHGSDYLARRGQTRD